MYFGCHNHTQYSNITAGLDCVNKLKDLVEAAQRYEMCGLAITNHDNLSEIVEINEMQKKLMKEGSDFKLAIGNEIYLVDSYDAEDKERQRFFHFILIAKDKIGYRTLIELSTLAWYRSTVKYGRRRVPTLKSDIETMMQTAKGHIVATTACLGGEFPYLVRENRLEEADEFLKWATDVFGYDDFFIELQPSKSKEQIEFNQYVNELEKKPKCIIATDAHYQSKADFPLFEAFLRSQQEQREVQEYYAYSRLMEEKEIYELMRNSEIDDEDTAEYLKNTVDIYNQIEFYDLAQDPKIPKVVLPDIKATQQIELSKYPTLEWAMNHEDNQTRYCATYCLNKMHELGIVNDTYLTRLEEEFDTFKFQSEELHDNFFCYFNTMQHYLEMAWEIDCAVGPSRGSASGSLLCYLMEIVQCDPLQYELPFWRFANKVRTSILDIDTDFQPSRRPALFEAIREERGELGLVQVATYRKLTLKAAIGNAGRGYRDKENPQGLDSDITTYLSSLIEVKRGFVASLKQTLQGDETMGFSVNHSFIKECEMYPGLLDIIAAIEGLIVGSSTHAAAVVLFDENDVLQDHCSLMRSPNGDMCTALDLRTVEMIGCIKYDYLLLSTLDIQSTCFKLLQQDNVIDPALSLKECYRTYIDPNKIDYANKRIWESFEEGNVLSVFQWNTAVARKGLLTTKPHNLLELTAVNALIRLMTVDDEEDQIERFCKIKQTPRLFEQEMVTAGLNEEQRQIMHEELDQYNGCAAMQESFMVLSQRLAGYTLKQADALRKTVAKKKMKEIVEQKELFFKQLGDAKEEVKNYLWRVIIAPSLGYGFSFSQGKSRTY